MLLVDRNKYVLLVFHVLLGVVISIQSQVLVLWFVIVFGVGFYSILYNKNSNDYLTYILGYLVGYEVLLRMTSSFLPWETGKYVTLIFVSLTLLLEARKHNISILVLIILLSLPSLALMDFSDRFRKDLVFNWFGLLILGFLTAYFYNRKYTIATVFSIFRVILYPLITLLVYLFIKTPDLSNVEFDLSANFQTTGGFGSNQISTILGLGIILTALTFFYKQTLFSKQIDILLLIIFLYRSFLSFSRGGVMGAVLILLVAYIAINYLKLIPLKTYKISFISLLFLLITIGGVFWYTNKLTEGTLLLRYQGETKTTLSGDRKKTLDVITSGRTYITRNDIKIWQDNIILGVGIGQSMDLRSKYGDPELKGHAAHLEYSRLLAEQGLFGLIIILILVGYPIRRFFQIKNPETRLFMLIFCGYALFTMAHSATRLLLPSFLYGVGSILLFNSSQLINLVQNKNKI
jgi:O-antigen ligase